MVVTDVLSDTNTRSESVTDNDSEMITLLVFLIRGSGSKRGENESRNDRLCNDPSRTRRVLNPHLGTPGSIDRDTRKVRNGITGDESH